MHRYGTNFVESEAILAADEDEEYLDEILGRMLPGELDRLELAARVLSRACTDMARAKRAGR